MNSKQFEDLWDDATDGNTIRVPVMVVDADGFVHDITEVVYDEEDRRMYIRTTWKGYE